ncbi:16S rRNA (cytosine(1402)-N(4))-methyltransferase RsmH [Methylomarinum sp. Ch1-1]|uniref:Ribosomal RNA small subunit methyltransferase H n=1 Tax=Methylomarinum roseum TaxID=3067653 RepID=A0AAU7NYN2_9GAMM|nr:16S rRNA (cytosine(1402)-N(4))-methyltransferase RsmH [Methylomarinum sp. Ch1-1]MDP4522176.1 16S rRNA (cytosine(1402)-N(4))-methyltransferase RsmH [Methylomarinum sp. Ch1-1]
MEHLSVLYEESLQALDIKPGGWYLDCTFGRGGHSRGILNLLGESGKLLAFDRDPDAIDSEYARELNTDSRFSLHYGCFSQLAEVVRRQGGAGAIDGVLMDLGVSSPQLDDPARGFSFLRDGPLDMRMDGNSALTAAQWLAQVEEKELVRVLFEYGEERFARKIARAIVEARRKTPLQTTLQLAKLIEEAIPFRDKHKHPATRTFQAIRIEINRELQEISDGLEQAVEMLRPEGRLVVISFHSLEDRIVKRFIRAESGRKYNPGRLPVKEEDIEQGRLKTIGKAIRAGKEEMRDNPRARSAVMRVAEKR